jgi:hypothetical protein
MPAEGMNKFSKLVLRKCTSINGVKQGESQIHESRFVHLRPVACLGPLKHFIHTLPTLRHVSFSGCLSTSCIHTSPGPWLFHLEATLHPPHSCLLRNRYVRSLRSMTNALNGIQKENHRRICLTFSTYPGLGDVHTRTSTCLQVHFG